ncbi:hypothetical protein [Pseudomonas alabamensis]|uniref:hypothetical protein n=1 Tax=Pseudomonas alabamensis TaxID=3064349 RepID=UPI0021DB5628|nr:hypothetical protein [Pseudomonas entomophila]
MSTPSQPDPLSRLSEALGNEYGQAREAQRGQVVADLREVIERVPEQSEFTNTARFKVLGPVLLLGALAMAAAGLTQDGNKLTIFGGLMALVFAVLTWQHRNSGRHVFMRLTRRQLFVDTLSAPVDLTDIVDVEVKDEGLVTQQKLIVRPDCTLPTHRATGKLFGNQAMALNKPVPHLRILSAGLMCNGRKLSTEEIAATLHAYWQAACAQRQLDALNEQGH